MLVLAARLEVLGPQGFAFARARARVADESNVPNVDQLGQVEDQVAAQSDVLSDCILLVHVSMTSGIVDECLVGLVEFRGRPRK